MGDQRDAYVEKLKGKIDEWNKDIDKLQEKTGQMASGAREKYKKQIEDLRAKQKEAQSKMDELQKAGGEAWVELKGGMDKAWKAMGEAVNSAKTKFKNTNKN